jgi:GAF domain-containing protein
MIEDAYSDSDVHLFVDARERDERRARERSPVRRDAAPRARDRGAGRGGREISSTLELATVMDRIAHHAKDLLHADNSAIFLPDAGGGPTARSSLSDDRRPDSRNRGAVRRRHHRQPARGGRAEFVNDTDVDPRGIQIAGTEQAEDERMMVAPLVAGEAVKGAMAVWRTGGKPFDAEELEFLVGLSRQATVALRERAAVRRDAGSARAARRPPPKCCA